MSPADEPQAEDKGAGASDEAHPPRDVGLPAVAPDGSQAKPPTRPPAEPVTTTPSTPPENAVTPCAPVWPRGAVAWALVCILAIAAAGSWRQAPAAPAMRPPHHQAEAWMAEAIPGVGPKTAAATAAAIRAWKLQELSPAIRKQVERYFRGPHAVGMAAE